MVPAAKADLSPSAKEDFPVGQDLTVAHQDTVWSSGLGPGKRLAGAGHLLSRTNQWLRRVLGIARTLPVPLLVPSSQRGRLPAVKSLYQAADLACVERHGRDVSEIPKASRLVGRGEELQPGEESRCRAWILCDDHECPRKGVERLTLACCHEDEILAVTATEQHLTVL